MKTNVDGKPCVHESTSWQLAAAVAHASTIAWTLDEVSYRMLDEDELATHNLSRKDAVGHMVCLQSPTARPSEKASK